LVAAAGAEARGAGAGEPSVLTGITTNSPSVAEVSFSEGQAYWWSPTRRGTESTGGGAAIEAVGARVDDPRGTDGKLNAFTESEARESIFTQ